MEPATQKLGQGLWGIQHYVRRTTSYLMLQKLNQARPSSEGLAWLVLRHNLYWMRQSESAIRAGSYLNYHRTDNLQKLFHTLIFATRLQQTILKIRTLFSCYVLRSVLFLNSFFRRFTFNWYILQCFVNCVNKNWHIKVCINFFCQCHRTWVTYEFFYGGFLHLCFW